MKKLAQNGRSVKRAPQRTAVPFPASGRASASFALRRQRLIQLPWIISSQFQFVAFRGADELEMEIIHHRRNSHKLLSILLTCLVDVVFQEEIKIALFPARPASLGLREFYFRYSDPGETLRFDVKAALLFT